MAIPSVVGPLAGVSPAYPAPLGRLRVEDVEEYIAVTCALSAAVPTLGIEVEWMVRAIADPAARPTVKELEAATQDAPLPGGGRLTFEPGGQLELSSAPARTPDEVVASVRRDLAVLLPTLREHGWTLDPCAFDSVRASTRVSDRSRYAAMEEYFAGGAWETAPEMMCSSAAVQVNVGCGADPAAAWRRANRIAPVLAAVFACSPDQGWASGRLRAWAGLDPSRTRSAFATGHPLADWTEYALEARAMLRRDSAGEVRCVQGRPCTFREWIEGAHVAGGPPTSADLELHLSSLFPPVRLKGWLEFRVIDVPPGDLWPAPLAVVSALMTAPLPPGSSTSDALDDVADVDWATAGRVGLTSPPLAAAAEELLALASQQLGIGEMADVVARFRKEVLLT